jgi:thiamine-phosphate pyrophosphorylase
MKLFVITPSTDFANEQSLVTKMFEAGLTTLQLRKPKYSTFQMTEYLKEIPTHFHNRIVIHSHHKLALKYKLKGIHLSKTHMSKNWRNTLVRFRIKLRFGKISKSRSYTRLQQIYKTEDQTFDYYLVGTMFNNMTGDFYSGFYEDGILAAIKNTNKKLVARGGTSPKVLAKTAKLGFYGIAFSSYLWNATAPYDNFLKILEEFKQHNIDIE